MEKLESLTLKDRPTGLYDLPVEIFKTVIDQVVLETGFYGALELRLVNKIFDTIVLDAVLNTSRDSHPDLGYLDASDELAYTALYRRVTDTATRNPPVVGKIREITAWIQKLDPSIITKKIHETLCHAVIRVSSTTGVFNYRTGDNHSSINEKHAKLNRALENFNLENASSKTWFLGLVYTVTSNREKLENLIEHDNLNLDYRCPAFGSIPIAAVRYADETTTMYIYGKSATCRPGGKDRQTFIRHASCYARMNIMSHLLNEDETSEQKLFSFMDCPRWATSSGHLELVKELTARCADFSQDRKKLYEEVFLTACTHGQLAIAEYIVNEMGYFPQPGDLGKGLRYQRPLCLATQSGNVEMVEWLLRFSTLCSHEEMLLSFKWAMRYAGLDMVQAYYEKATEFGYSWGKGYDEKDSRLKGCLAKAGIDAARKGRAEHLRWAMQHGLEFKGGDERTVVSKTASAGYLNCLNVLRDLLPGYVEIANEEMAKLWKEKDRRGVETLIADGIAEPPGFRKDWLRNWKYESRIVPTRNWSRKRDGIWPHLWNYSTHF